jgi:hypothetical protein
LVASHAGALIEARRRLTMAYSSSDFVEVITSYFAEQGLIHEMNAEDSAQMQAEQAMLSVTALLEIKELATKLASATLSGKPPEEIAALAAELQTMAERTRPQYLVAENWGHCFVGSNESTTRWVIDLENSREAELSLVKAQVLSGGRWEDLSESEENDLLEGLEANYVLTAALEYDLAMYWALPEWAEGATAREAQPEAQTPAQRG